MLAEFLRQEAQASRRFMDRHADADFQAPTGSVAYSRSYRCECCGFTCSDPGAIYEHAHACGAP